MIFVPFISKWADIFAHLDMIGPLFTCSASCGAFSFFRLLGFVIKFFSNLWNILAFLCRIWLEGKIIITKERRIYEEFKRLSYSRY